MMVGIRNKIKPIEYSYWNITLNALLSFRFLSPRSNHIYKNNGQWYWRFSTTEQHIIGQNNVYCKVHIWV